MLSLYLSLVDNEEQRSLVEQIYYDCEQIMYRAAYSILHNKQDAEDAVHDAFLRIVSDIDRIASVDPGKRRNYAVIVAKNIAIDHYRKNKKQVDIRYSEKCVGERNAVADLPYVEFFTPGGNTRVIFDKTGILERKNNQKCFGQFHIDIQKFGYSTFDVS